MLLENIKDLVWFIERGNIELDRETLGEFDYKYCVDGKKLTRFGWDVIDGPYNGNGLDWFIAKIGLKPVVKWRSFIKLLEICYPKRGVVFRPEIVDMVRRSSTVNLFGAQYVVLNRKDRATYGSCKRDYEKIMCYEEF